MALRVEIESDRIREIEGVDTFRLTLKEPSGLQQATFADLTRIDLAVIKAHIEEALR